MSSCDNARTLATGRDAPRERVSLIRSVRLVEVLRESTERPY